MKEVLQTSGAPAAIGPYSQGILAGGFLFTSGQIPIDPETGKIPDGIEDQTRQSLKNVEAILSQAGLGLDALVKVTVFLKDMDHFSSMNRVYAEVMEGISYPARSAVEVARLPRDVMVEIEAVALVKE